MLKWKPRRVAITGLGAITALGHSREATWNALTAGISGISAIEAWSTENYSTKIAGEIKDFDPAKHFDRKRARRLDRCHQLAIVASREALADARLTEGEFDPARVGVIIGSSLGGMLSGQTYDRELLQRGRLRGYHLLSHPLHVCVDELTKEFGFLGCRTLISTACTASTIAIGHAVDLIRSGHIDIALTGGVDPLSDFSFAGFSSMKNVSTVPCAPYSEPVGLNTGEAAGMIVLEDLDRALARGAHIYAELAHYALSADAYHATSPDPTGQNQKRALLDALRCAGLSPDDVDYVNAHGTGTMGNDLTESRVLSIVFGQRARSVPVSSVKGALGHTLGAAGGIEALITALAVDRGVIPPTANFREARAGCELDYVPNHARKRPVTVAVSQNFAFGGNNAVLVFARHDRPSPHPLTLANRRVVITGFGLVTPIGCGTGDFLAALRNTQNGIAPVAGFDTSRFSAHLGGIVPEPDLAQHSRNVPRRIDRIGHFTVVGSDLALRHAGVRVTRENAERIGIIAGTSQGPVQSCKIFHREVAAGCPQKANPAVFPNTVVNAGAGLAAINLRLRGPNIALSIGQASGLAAMCQAFELVRSGAVDFMIAGGTDELESGLFEAFAASKLVAPYLRNRNGFGPVELSCPFDERRSGMVLGEGAVFAVLESLDSALARNARIYGEIAGYHVCADRPVHLGWDPSGEGMLRSMQTAMDMGGLAKDDIGYVAAAAMSHPLHDKIEARALNELFGPRGVPVSALSSMVGMSAVTGPLALSATLLGMSEGFLPSGINYEHPDPECDLDIVHGGLRSVRSDAVLINSASLGGTNVTLAVTTNQSNFLTNTSKPLGEST
ncbi:MAG TPA: beta-ketoacyl-[acyl-carrier-protein] synthase family protein [Bryobacteraceae bacterium]|nr:beta-ketoacyl-[acyl-carrier-protein] synthase family protein [Bryobacteraceae bacterium]